jgi:protein-S-isoprenylcysteine O-methyltransferase Ste14
VAVILGVIRAAFSRPKSGLVRIRPGRTRDRLALTIAVAGFVVPMVWAITGFPWFAEFRSSRTALVSGAAIQVIALFLFYRSHRDLGSNFSSKLRLRLEHELITTGVYRRIRHPMYLSLILVGIGQALVVPNWIAAPTCLAGTVVLYLLRVDPEEEMLQERFGYEYEQYAERTGRLLPFSDF